MRHPTYEELSIGSQVWLNFKGGAPTGKATQWAVAEKLGARRVTIINLKTRKVRRSMPLSDLWVK